VPSRVREREAHTFVVFVIRPVGRTQISDAMVVGRLHRPTAARACNSLRCAAVAAVLALVRADDSVLGIPTVAASRRGDCPQARMGKRATHQLLISGQEAQRRLCRQCQATGEPKTRSRTRSPALAGGAPDRDGV